MSIISSLIGDTGSGKSRLLAARAIEADGPRFFIPNLDGIPLKRELWDANVTILDVPKTVEEFLTVLQTSSPGSKVFVDGVYLIVDDGVGRTQDRTVLRDSLLCAAFSIVRARDVDLTFTVQWRRTSTFTVSHPWNQTDEVWVVNRNRPSKIWDAGPSKLDAFGVLLDGDLL